MDARAGLDGCGKSRPPTGIRSPDRPARSESLHRLSYSGPRCPSLKHLNSIVIACSVLYLSIDKKLTTRVGVGTVKVEMALT